MVKKDFLTGTAKSVLDCKTRNIIKAIKPVKTDKGHNIFIVDKEILFNLHQLRIVQSLKIANGENCYIEFPEYSPYLYHSLARQYGFEKLLLHEEYDIINEEEKQVKIRKLYFEVVFNKDVKMIIELDIDNVCVVYTPPQPRRRKKRRKF